MIITTSQERDLVGSCGCPCSYPAAPAPRKECQSLSRTADASDSADTEYDDEYADWAAAGATHDAWVANPVGPEPPAAGPEPTKPAGYDDWDHGGWGPFAEPTGEPTDDLPTIYRRSKSNSETITGTAGVYSSYQNEVYGSDIPDSAFYVNRGSYEGATFTNTEYWWFQDDPIDTENYPTKTGSSTVTFGKPPNSWNSIYTGEPPWVTDGGPFPDCEATVRILEKEVAVDGTEPSPGTGPFGNNDPVGWIDAERELKDELSDGITKPALIEKAKAMIPAWPEIAEGSICNSSLVVDWPKIQEFYSGDPAGWPACSTDPPPDAAASAAVTKARYRIGVPESFSTVEVPRSVYEAQWDEVFFPSGHDRTINDPDITPPDPLPEGWEHPQIPDPDAPDPSLITARSWIWGGNMETPFSEWFEVEIPKGEGETRVVNMLVKAYHSTRLGVVPTAHGEQWDVEEQPLDMSTQKRSFQITLL